MKKISYFLAAALMMTSSCKKFVEGYDVSPNSPVDVPINLLLPAVEVSTFAIYTGQLARVAAVFTHKNQLNHSSDSEALCGRMRDSSRHAVRRMARPDEGGARPKKIVLILFECIY